VRLVGRGKLLRLQKEGRKSQFTGGKSEARMKAGLGGSLSKKKKKEGGKKKQ